MSKIKKQINKQNKAATPIKPRYLEKSNKKPKTSELDNINCTFTPKVNEVKKNMPSAQIYLEMNPFERLSRSAQTTTQEIHLQAKETAPLPSSAPSQDTSQYRIIVT
jgi:hypothetical protein